MFQIEWQFITLNHVDDLGDSVVSRASGNLFWSKLYCCDQHIEYNAVFFLPNIRHLLIKIIMDLVLILVGRHSL